jgi:hypothetical protein
MKSKTCEARVWDNGDTRDCGKPAAAAERCSEHALAEISMLQGAIRSYEKKIGDARARIADLSSGVQDHLTDLTDLSVQA